tara:strand:- start:1729 stop:2148 length:420 start_codon:yes stop_codon:yes gene_type:complete
MTSYFTSLFSLFSTYLKDKINYYFYATTETPEKEVVEINDDLDLFKFKIQEYVTENNLSIDIYKMYDELEKYNPVVGKSKKMRFIIGFLENELNYIEKLGQFKEEKDTQAIVDRIEKTTIFTKLLNNFKTVKNIEKNIN